MRRLFPRWFAALLVGLLGTLALLATGASSPAGAAPCVPSSTTVPDAVSAADAVVTATVSKRVAPAAGGQARYLAQVTASFKGTATGAIQVLTQRRSCHVATLAPGTTYLLFLRRQHRAWLAPADFPSSSNVAVLQPQVEAALAPPVVAFGEPQTGAPKSLRRVAAPGVALVIIGLLGLLFVRPRRTV